MGISKSGLSEKELLKLIKRSIAKHLNLNKLLKEQFCDQEIQKRGETNSEKAGQKAEGTER